MLPFLGFCAMLVDDSTSFLNFVAFPNFLYHCFAASQASSFCPLYIKCFPLHCPFLSQLACFYFFVLARSAYLCMLFAAQASSDTRYLKSKNIIVLLKYFPFLCQMPVLFTRKYLILMFHSNKSSLYIFSKVFESADLHCADFYTSV